MMIDVVHYWLNLKGVLLIKKIEKENNLDIFKMIGSISETKMELVNRELLIFKHYQVNVKNIKLCNYKY
jgi:hypothetical protein